LIWAHKKRVQESCANWGWAALSRCYLLDLKKMPLLDIKNSNFDRDLSAIFNKQRGPKRDVFDVVGS
jgi:hypothetical protein